MQPKSLLILVLFASTIGSIFYFNLNSSQRDEVHISEVREKDRLVKEIEKQYNNALEEIEELKTRNQLLEGELTTCRVERQLLAENQE